MLATREISWALGGLVGGCRVRYDAGDRDDFPL